MEPYSSRADKLQAARREVRATSIGGLTLLTVAYVGVGLGLGYVQDFIPSWRVAAQTAGWYWIGGLAAVLAAAVGVWVCLGRLSRNEAREAVPGRPLPPRQAGRAGMSRMSVTLTAFTVALFGFSLGVAGYFEWTWWTDGQPQRLWAFGAWALALGLVVGLVLLISGVSSARRETRQEASDLIAAGGQVVTEETVVAMGQPRLVTTTDADGLRQAVDQVLNHAESDGRASTDETPTPVATPAPTPAVSVVALPPHRTNWGAVLGRALAILIWIALIAGTTGLEMRLGAEASEYRYYPLAGLAVLAVVWWAVGQALAGRGKYPTAAVVRHRVAKPKPVRPPKRRRVPLPASSLEEAAATAEPIVAEPAEPEPVAAEEPEEAQFPVPDQPETIQPEPATTPAEPQPKAKPARVPKPGPQRRTWVGLDLGSRTIRVVQVAPGKPYPVVVNFASAPTPDRSVKDGVVIRPTAVADAINDLLNKAGIKQRRVIAALSGQAVILRQAQFPLMSSNELREALKWESEQHIPIPADEAIVDFAILGEGAPAGATGLAAITGPAGSTAGPAPAVTGPSMQVLLVATQKRIVQGYLDTFEAARLKPVALEVDLLAVYRALQTDGYLPEEGHPVAILNMGAANAGLSLFANHSAQLTRTIAAGGEVFAQSIMEAFQETPAGAEALLREHGAKPLTPIARCVSPVVDELSIEVRRSLEFYLIKNRQYGIKQLFIVGGAAVLPGLAEAVADSLNDALRDKNPGGQAIEVIVPDPSRRLTVAGPARARLDQFGPDYMQALGLALREESPQ
ncbi:MAG TPA: pilus assembly protein PilM [Bacillota bacterium]|jgi:type IV pilus assembly protein PilM